MARKLMPCPAMPPIVSHTMMANLSALTYFTGDNAISDLSDVFKVSRPTIYRTLARQPAAV